MEARLRQALARAEEVARQLADPETARNPAKLKQLGREHAQLDEVRQTHDRLGRLEAELAQAREVLDDRDPELSQLARADVERLRPEVERLRADLAELLTPRDPLDDRDAIVEIRAGTGGDEAALFAAELFRMYTRFAERKGWKVEVVSLSEGNLGGLKEAIFAARGPGVYGTLRYESGVHRVQRVPVTEAQGRIHTSAATVAVLPEAEEVDVKIEDKDLRIDVFRSQGPGGQSVNTTDSAVRITHLPTNLVVQCQDQKSQLQNKIKALEVLRSRLLDKMIAEQEASRARERRAQVGTGDRAAGGRGALRICGRVDGFPDVAIEHRPARPDSAPRDRGAGRPGSARSRDAGCGMRDARCGRGHRDRVWVHRAGARGRGQLRAGDRGRAVARGRGPGAPERSAPAPGRAGRGAPGRPLRAARGRTVPGDRLEPPVPDRNGIPCARPGGTRVRATRGPGQRRRRPGRHACLAGRRGTAALAGH